jgi:ketosteroid isomerase-like protein
VPRALALLLLAPAAAAQPARPDSAAALAAVGAFHAALAAADTAAALALLAPDALVLEAGGAETRAEYAAHHLAADVEFARAVSTRRTPVAVWQAGDVVWVAQTSESTGRFRGRDVSSAGAELVVLARAGAGWAIRAIHWSSRSRR